MLRILRYQGIKCVKIIPKITVKYVYNVTEIQILWCNCFSSSVVPDLSRQIAKASFIALVLGFDNISATSQIVVLIVCNMKH